MISLTCTPMIHCVMYKYILNNNNLYLETNCITKTIEVQHFADMDSMWHARPRTVGAPVGATAGHYNVGGLAITTEGQEIMSPLCLPRESPWKACCRATTTATDTKLSLCFVAAHASQLLTVVWQSILRRAGNYLELWHRWSLYESVANKLWSRGSYH